MHAAIVSLNIAKKLQNVGKSAQGSITTDSGSSLRMPSGQVIRPMNDITQWQVSKLKVNIYTFKF